MKEQALKLADELEEFYVDPDGFPYMIHESATMIRRLVEELDKQSSSIWDSFRRVHESCQCDSCRRKTAPQTKLLSDEEIDKLADEYLSDYFNIQETINFVRAIEERHGIK